MRNISSPIRPLAILGSALALLAASGQGNAAEPTLAISGLATPVVSGRPANLWLAALNASGAAVAWEFPSEIACRLVSPGNSTHVTARLLDSTLGSPVSIAAGGFRCAEYALPLPDNLLGEVILEFTDLPLNRILLVVEQPPAETTAAKPETPLWKKLLRDAEPQDAGDLTEPGRFFKEHIFGYEPFCFIAGTESPNAKFQVSVKYRLLNETGALARKAPALTGLHLAYTQTSLWDWNAESRPFYDSSYKPEVLYSWERLAGGEPAQWFRLDLQGGVQHESNGKSAADSRSLNIA